MGPWRWKATHGILVWQISLFLSLPTPFSFSSSSLSSTLWFRQSEPASHKGELTLCDSQQWLWLWPRAPTVGRSSSSPSCQPPAKVLAEFAKEHKALNLAGGFNDLGHALSEDEVKSLAAMPTKNPRHIIFQPSPLTKKNAPFLLFFLTKIMATYKKMEV